MKEFANLARIATSRTVARLPLLDLASAGETKEQQLVRILLETPEASQLQVTKSLYGRGGTDNVRAMKRLQARVQNKLLNQLFFLDNSDPRMVVARRYELECLSMLHKGRILYAEGEYVLSERVLLRALRLAKEGEFTQYILQSQRLLRTLYVEKRRHLHYKRISKEIERWEKVWAWEEEAERVSTDMQLGMVQSVAARNKLLPQMPKYLTSLDGLHRKAKTFNTFIALYRTKLAYEELQGDFREIVRITGLAVRRLRDGELNARRFDKRFNSYMHVYAYLRSQQPLQGLKLAEGYAREFHPSSSNWVYFQETHFLLALHAEQYARAHQILVTVRRSPTFLKLREAAQQRWDLYQAYADFVQPAQRSSPGRRQMLEQLVHTMPDYSRDKRGHNVAILVLQLVHFLRERALDELLARVERLRKYQQRHLREESNLRNRLFLRLLFVMVEKDFDPVASAERGKRLLLQLRNTPPPGDAFAEVEIVPYEHLWKICLQIMRTGAPLAREGAPAGRR